MVSLATQKLIIQIIRNAQSERELRRTQNAKVSKKFVIIFMQ